MIPDTPRAMTAVAGRRITGVVLVALVTSGLCLTGCSVVKAVSKIAHDVEGNKATIDAFTSKINNNSAVPFEAVYVTTGSAPATILYAVQPPKGLAFTDTPSGTTRSSGGEINSFDVVVNNQGEFACTPPNAGGSSTWQCQKLSGDNAAAENKVFDFYTPSHWVTFLRDFSLAAGLAGDQVSSSSMTLNGFSMSCVDLVASGVPGKSTICTTSQGILGYVKVAGDSTSFEIERYSSSPTASLFQLPPGAKIVLPPTTTT
jgi:outer membrane murein-binding lipoprotein Lpp